MRVDIKETNVYKFNELEDDAKQHAIEKLYDLNVDHDWWDWTVDEFKEDMKAIGFDVDNVYFSGFSSQGDGACFTGQMNDLRLFLLKHKMGNKFRKFLNSSDCFMINSKHSGHYSHSGCMQISVEEDRWNYATDSITQDDFSKFEEWITEQLRDYADELYKKLNKEYDWLTSEEQIIETIELNEYEFTEDGNLY